MRVLGYHGETDVGRRLFGSGQGGAAALVAFGSIVAAAEENRLPRSVMRPVAQKPRWLGLPVRAIEHCLRTGGIGAPDDVTLICVSSSPSDLFAPEVLEANRDRMSPRMRLLLGAALGALRRAVRLSGGSDAVRRTLFEKSVGGLIEPASFRVIPLHLCRLASAFYPSPFHEALSVTLDGPKEGVSALIGVGRDNRVSVLRALYAPNSIGLLRALITRYLGFPEGSHDEVATLSLSGDPSRFRAFFEQLVTSDADGYFSIDPGWLSRLVLRDLLWPARPFYPRAMTAALGAPRAFDEPLVARHADIAAALWEAIVRVVLTMLRRLRDVTGQSSLCLSGAVAQSSLLVGEIARSGLFDRVWIQPFSPGAGAALGAALYGYYTLLGAGRLPLPREPIYLGQRAGAARLSRAILKHGRQIRHHRPACVVTVAARALSEGKIVGWYQGRSEVGLRALGHRSLLSDPRCASAAHRLGCSERQRPLSVACLREHAASWFDFAGVKESPYGEVSVPVRDGSRVQASISALGMVRVQTVSQEDCPQFRALLQSFYELTNVPVLLQTELCEGSGPMVEAPEEAIQCLLRTDMDMLVIGDTVLVRRSDVEGQARRSSNPTPGSAARTAL